jgi:hypothetical protein
MTKARDLANASTALSAVDATELGYLDGVTSAVQTQMDAKAPSSTAVTLTGTQTLTNKTLTNPVISSVINNTLTSTTGDIIYASGANTPARLAIGTSADVLTVSGGIPAWAAPAGGGKVVQIVGATSSTQLSTTSATYVDSNLTVTITPTSASNNVLVFVSSAVDVFRAASSAIGSAKLLRGITSITDEISTFGVNQGTGSDTEAYHQFNLIYLDAPATTSATTYKLQVKGSSGTRVRIQNNNTIGSIIAIEVAP